MRQSQPDSPQRDWRLVSNRPKTVEARSAVGARSVFAHEAARIAFEYLSFG